MDIKILGTGCPKCRTLEKNARDAVSELKVSAHIEKVTDINKIIEYGVMMTPGLVINGEVISTGKILSKDEIKKLIQKNNNK